MDEVASRNFTEDLSGESDAHSFFSRIYRQLDFRRFDYIVAVCTILGVVVNLLAGNLPNPWPRWLPASINLAIIVGATCALAYRRPEIRCKREMCGIVGYSVDENILALKGLELRDRQETRRRLVAGINFGVYIYFYSWLCVWALWIVMYLCRFLLSLCVDELQVSQRILAERSQFIIENGLNVLTSLILICIYWVMARVGMYVLGIKSGIKYMLAEVGAFAVVAVGLFLLELYDPIPKGEAFVVTTSIAVRLTGVGLVAAIPLMSVVGRMNSGALRINRFALNGMYLYAAVQIAIPWAQAMWPHLGVNHPSQPLRDILMASALIGKLFLYLVVIWTLRRHRYVYYMLRLWRRAKRKKSGYDVFHESVFPKGNLSKRSQGAVGFRCPFLETDVEMVCPKKRLEPPSETAM